MIKNPTKNALFLWLIISCLVFPADTTAQNTNVPALTPAFQSISYHTVPARLTVGGAAGGGNNYQWQISSIDKESSWQTIPGASSSTYSPGVLDSTAIYRVRLKDNSGSPNWARAVINVFSALNAGAVIPSSQTLAYDGIPTVLSIAGVGGSDGNFSYQWYNSTDSVNWTPLTAYTPQYIPGAVEKTTWYRVTVTSRGISTTSMAATVYLISSAPPIQNH